MRALVTGGCGFIGAHLVDALAGLGHEVAVLDDLSTGSRGRLHPAARLIEGSIADADAVAAACEGVEAVFHAAALARVGRSLDDPVGTHEVNATGALRVFEAARRAGVARVVHSSSSSVYGDQPEPLLREDMTPRPKSPYGLQKLIAEQYAEQYARLFGLSVVSLRYFNVYGPGQPSEGAYELVIPRFLRLREAGEPLTVYGDGEQTRAYTHVSDVVRANLLAAAAGLPRGEHLALNVGTREETSVNAIAALIGGPAVHVPHPREAFEERRKAADWSRAREAIGWEPRVPLAEGLRGLAGTGAAHAAGAR